MIGGDIKWNKKVRKIFTQIVNSLTAKMEIGSPMGDEDKNKDEECGSDRDELDVMEELAEDIPKNDCSFKPCHSQYHTHKAHMQKRDPLVVPNFLPNVLPRSDRGDREYYCCTMLTFFKPWQTGKDLRAESDTWDKSFVAHEFTKRQAEIMKYLNV